MRAFASDSAALILDSITASSSIQNLNIESNMGGIVAFEGNGSASLVLENITVTIEKGFGIATENLNVVCPQRRCSGSHRQRRPPTRRTR